MLDKNKQYPNLLLFEEVTSVNLTTVLDKMEQSCRDYLKTDQKRSALDPLHGYFWQTLQLLIPSFVTEQTKENFEIPAAFHNWVNYGNVSANICPEYESLIAIDEVIPDNIKDIYDEYEVFYLDKWLKYQHEANIKLKHSMEVAVDLKKAEQAKDRYPLMLKQGDEQRKLFLERYPEATEMIRISKEIDNRLFEYNEIKAKIDNGQRVTVQQRESFVKLTNDLNNLRERRAKEQIRVSGKVPHNEAMSLDRSIENVISRKQTIEKRLETARKAYEEDAAFRANLPVGQCKELIKEEVRRLRSMSELIGKRARLKQCSVLTGRSPIPTPLDIVFAIEEVLEVDPTLFTRSVTGRTKFPNIVVIPAFGDGSYDFEKNALLIPTRPIKGVLQAVATALVEYHLDSPAGQRFRDSYQKLNKNSSISSSIQLRDSMVKDYINWVTMEAKGYQTLDADTRKWFIENIAPSMFALRHSRRMGDLVPSEAHGIIEECENLIENTEQGFDVYFKLGVACWRVGHYSKANLSFMKATKLNPDSLDAAYNAAMSAFKTGQKKKAIDLWRKYLDLDKASFWTLRVQKFLGTIK